MVVVVVVMMMMMMMMQKIFLKCNSQLGLGWHFQ
jgi:hypothetical protein